MSSEARASREISRPRGTRDLYPNDAAKRRHLTETWRTVSTRHGFEEVDGPTFEHLDLYTIKSGEEIVDQLFSFQRAGGESRFALRPEFTPTLARLYAARAGSLPNPTKWFNIGPFFRAERPQRGRLREFLQWNADLIGGGHTPEERAETDAELIACCIGALEAFGLTPDRVRIHINDREAMARRLVAAGVPEDQTEDAFFLLDRREKAKPDALREMATQRGLETPEFLRVLEGDDPPDVDGEDGLGPLRNALHAAGVTDWCTIDPNVVRGLAYYTGTVFEAVVDGERAVAGGGRYDNLIELMGGPPTPAVGFAMGDVVLSLVLEDCGLLPTEEQLRDRAGQRPDAFVVSAGDDEAQSHIVPLVAALRRPGPNGEPPLHARRSRRATRNVGKLLKEASSGGARYAVIIEDASSARIKHLESGEQKDVPLDAVHRTIAAWDTP